MAASLLSHSLIAAHSSTHDEAQTETITLEAGGPVAGYTGGYMELICVNWNNVGGR